MNSSGTITATNTYGFAGLISRHTSSGSTFYEFDNQGAVAERLNSAGSCTTSSTADAIGVVTNSATDSDPFGYEAQAGYYTDQSTGLILTTFRYYDPGAGRFLNRDPIGYDGGINIYGYTNNNPENNVDTLGLNTPPSLPPSKIIDPINGITITHHFKGGGEHPPAHVHVTDTNTNPPYTTKVNGKGEHLDPKKPPNGRQRPIIKKFA